MDEIKAALACMDDGRYGTASSRGTDPNGATRGHPPRAAEGTATEPAAPGASGTALNVEAHDISLMPKEFQAKAGDVTIRYTNSGVIQRTLLIDGVDGFKLDVTTSGDADSGTVRLAPGAYTMYCDVPGHRAAGMEGRLVVS